jgi:two-component system, sensor histidine kinase
MISAALPASEEYRLEILDRYDILDTPPEQTFDDVTLLASQICETPIALVSLVDTHRQWFKSRVGLEATHTPRNVSFCGHAILQDEVFVVEDTLEDPRFIDNPLVLDNPRIRFYAGAPLKTPSGENIGTICVIDKTPRELTETQKNSLLALSRQVVTQIELRFALQSAKSETRLKALFLANISHEIRTPMGAISSCTNLLMDQIEDGEQQKILAMISNASKGLISLIDEILNVSKQELEGFDVNYISINPRDLVAEVVQMLGVQALEMDRTILTYASESVPESIIGDPNRIRQLLYNLAGNGLKFCSHTVTVSLDVKQTPNGDKLLVAVKDDGTGIAEEHQARIFQQFVQANTSIGLPEVGTGLGLSICKSLCKAMKGTISVASKPGDGALFSVELPLRVAQESDVAREPPVDFEFDSKMSEKLPTRILVAEDSEVNQFIISAMLGKLGYTTDLVSGGIAAVEASQRGNYDLIFMDIRMPDMNGQDATREIRKAAIRQPTIVALTANAFNEDKLQALAAGMDSFLTKPVDLKSLVDAIKSARTSPANIDSVTP